MDITIQNCNNIDSGTVQIVENSLNIKYAINGTGKSTISRAILKSVSDRVEYTNSLLDLTPFKAIGDDKISPNVLGCDSINSVKVFDETYINDFVYQEDELLKGSFEILIRDVSYDNYMHDIDLLVSKIKSHFLDNDEVDSLINDLNELSISFGKPVKSGIHGSSALAKALKDGNNIDNIPEGLEIYKDYIQGTDNVKWIKWQLDGNQFIDRSDNCPYCISDILEIKDTIKKVSSSYDSSSILNLNKIIAVFKRLECYFSKETGILISEFIENLNGYTNKQIDFLIEVKSQIDNLNNDLNRLKNIGFSSFKDVSKVIDELKSYKIDTTYYTHLQSDDLISKIQGMNVSLTELISQAGPLQGKVVLQKRHIERLINENKTLINEFLKNAGYKYKVDLLEDEKGFTKLKLIHVDVEGNEVNNVDSKLSHGEKNAFALVLFMFDAVKSNSDLIVLDDPISSFDKNKKYAIIDMLFRKNNSFRGKTVLLLSHDFEPIVDMLYHHTDRFDKPNASFLENINGTLNEIEILKGDIQTFIGISQENILQASSIVEKLVYLRRIYEILNKKEIPYQLLSNVFHKRIKPKVHEIISNIQTERDMTQSEILLGSEEIIRIIPDFDYNTVIKLLRDDNEMKKLYASSTNNYEKLHIYRIIFDGKESIIQADIIQKFINEAFHIENDYIFQLNPSKFQTVPQYVINECDRFIS